MTTIAQIAAAFPAYQPQAMSVNDVHAFLAQLLPTVQEQQQLQLLQASGRVLAQDIISPIDVPAQHNSAMDGYAFDSRHIKPGEPLRLHIAGRVLAGEVWRQPIASNQCVQIMTGAPLPAGLDTVVAQELVQRCNDCISVAPDSVAPGDNCRWQGEDLRQGEPALRQGEWLTPAALGLAASLGLTSVPVWRALKVAYFSTGNEIISPGQALTAGAVYDSNRFTIGALLAQLGCEVVITGPMPDEPAALQAALKQASSQADVVITSGGASVGAADYSYDIIKRIGEAACWRINMRPGQRLIVGQIKSRYADTATPAAAQLASTGPADSNTCIVFALPGNPVAAMISLLILLRPALLQMMGRQASPPLLLTARSTQTLNKKPGRAEYLRAVVSVATDGMLEVSSSAKQSSGVLSSMARANALIVLPEPMASVAAGGMVKVILLEQLR